MANKEHLAILRQGRDVWNGWRLQNPDVIPDLSDVTFKKDNPNLAGANLNRADFYKSTLWRVNLSRANLTGARLSSVNLNGATLDGANLTGANLRFARLVGASLQDAILVDCLVYGVSAWNLKGTPKEQSNLIITPPSEPVITVDTIEVSQFVYLLLNNPKIRDVIDTVSKKAVLILGRFTTERKAVLEGIQSELRTRGYLPIVFNFDKPTNRDITETVSTLAHLSRFIVADITDAKSIPQELQAVVPNLPSVPVQPLLLASQHEYGMFEHFKRYHWVLETYIYESQDALLNSLQEGVIEPAEAKAFELTHGNN